MGMAQRSEGYGRALPIRAVILTGVCASGKSTIQQLLNPMGIRALGLAQEHSLVPALHARYVGHPLVYLAAGWPTVFTRRPRPSGREFYRVELGRVRHALLAADLVVHTDRLSPHEVATIIVDWWDRWTGIDRYTSHLGINEQVMLRRWVASGEDPIMAWNRIQNMSQSELSDVSPV